LPIQKAKEDFKKIAQKIVIELKILHKDLKTTLQKCMSKHGAVLINMTNAGCLTVFDCKKICFLGGEVFCKGRGVRR